MIKAFSFFKKLLIFTIFLLFLAFILSRGKIYHKDEFSYGVSFSQKHAISLGLDWKKAYLAIFDDLGVKKIRIPAYWDDLEKEDDQFFWEDLDWQIDQARQNDAEIILAIGGRLPRWPECHFPEWIKDSGEEDRQEKLLNYIEETVKRYRDKKEIVAWQIENEPFLRYFGECPKLNKEFFDQEIELVKNLDDRPLVITDSGELSIWVPAARRADIFGTSLYLKTYSKALDKYISYPIKPGFFRFKKNLAGIFAHPEKWIVIELQAEPWGKSPYQNLSEEEKSITMDLEKFKNIIEFSSKTGFNEFYLWGAEWWYWEKEENNNSEYWQEAKKLF